MKKYIITAALALVLGTAAFASAQAAQPNAAPGQVQNQRGLWEQQRSYIQSQMAASRNPAQIRSYQSLLSALYASPGLPLNPGVFGMYGLPAPNGAR
jgi:hypothetical protein